MIRRDAAGDADELAARGLERDSRGQPRDDAKKRLLAVVGQAPLRKERKRP